jgi:hypothetical protein
VGNYGDYTEVYPNPGDARRTGTRVSRFVGDASSPAAPRQTLQLYVVAEMTVTVWNIDTSTAVAHPTEYDRNV